MALKTIVPLWLPPQKKYLYKSIDTNSLYITIKNYTIDHICLQPRHTCTKVSR